MDDQSRTHLEKLLKTHKDMLVLLRNDVAALEDVHQDMQKVLDKGAD